MKKRWILISVVCTAVLLNLGGCQQEENNTAPSVKVESESELAEIPNPWIDCTSTEEAEEKAGFSVTVPDQLNGYEEKDISVIEKELIQVTFRHKDEELYFRKGQKKTQGNDISGDYREADASEKKEIQGVTVTFKEADGKILVAIWTDGDYSYAIGSSEGIEAETMTSLVQSLR